MATIVARLQGRVNRAPRERIVTLVTLGVFSLITLAAVVMSTALTITEGQRDSATLAAIGGTRRTRRFLAAVHALLVGAVGVLLGTVLGLVIGGVMSWTSTQVNSDSKGYAGWLGNGDVVAIPWVALGLATVAIPAIAAVVDQRPSSPDHDQRHELIRSLRGRGAGLRADPGRTRSRPSPTDRLLPHADAPLRAWVFNWS